MHVGESNFALSILVARVVEFLYVDVVHHVVVGGEYGASGVGCIQSATLYCSLVVGDDFDNALSFSCDMLGSPVGIGEGCNIDGLW